MASATLAFTILARDQASKTFDGVGKASTKLRGGLLKTAAKLGLVVGAADLAADAVRAFGDFLGSAIDEARDAEKVGKVTAQIIKSTGGAAKVSAGHVGDLSEKIGEKAGVDDEAVQSGANLLLTFKKVRNETGKGANVFDRATQAAVDLAAAGFGSITSNSKILGQALNDPVKGLGKLKKAGVDLTDQQKKQIKTMVAAGDVLGAQKIILGEVESQVGGVADASASMSDKVKASWDNFKEQVGTALLPVLDRLGDWFLKKGLPAIKRFGGWVLNNLWPALKKGYDTIMPGVKKALDILTGGVGDSKMTWKQFGDIITQKVIPFIAKMTNVYLPAWARQIRAIIEVVKVAWKIFTTWRDIMLRAASVVMTAFIGVTRIFSNMLRALSHVPGFGWAKTAADKMDRAADKAEKIKRNIDRIPNSKSVNITVNERYKSVGSSRFKNQGVGYSPGRAAGGPVVRGTSYLVGENGPEMFTASSTGHITPAGKTADALRGSGRSSGGSTSDSMPAQIIFNMGGRQILNELLVLKRGRGTNLGLA